MNPTDSMPQSEQQLENTLIKQLQRLGFEFITLQDSEAVIQNLKTQLEKFNKTVFSDTEFERILNHLQKGDRFDKAKTLRDRFNLRRDNETDFFVRFFNMDQWCKNEYQVAQQVTQQGQYENRYDVTLLINGLPLVQVELKRRGMELKEAFNQIQRYHRHSFSGTLFEYVQVFVISNGVNTKYFSNNPKQTFEQTFYWTDKENQKITKLEDFAEVFLEKCAVSQMIAEYIVLAEAERIPMILRPYQYYAVRAIVDRVKHSNKNGYIWHTTGSGKTLTSYKTSQILSRIPEIKKVLFVVDRKDLDIQTTKEFNSFSAGSVDGTEKTRALVKQLKDPNRKLIVTTIQKLDRAIAKQKFLKELEYLADEKVVIIFDECHRSQFGKTHKAIKNFFKHAQLFGFTGTPIFAENHTGGVTTADVFDEALHRYIITNAISDGNVLGFAVEYVGKYTQKDDDVLEKDIFADIEIDRIDIKEVLEDESRLEKITDYILQDWKRKTKNGKFNALFAVSRVDVLKRYYEIFRKKKSPDFKVATIFTYQANEQQSEDLDTDAFIDVGDVVNKHSREFLEGCIRDYNEMFGTNFGTDRFYEYYKDLQRRVKNKELDLVIVVNMFLTGFDAKRLNTLYLDKNLRYHGLVQAYSRTNRLLNSDKPHGNIVSFRNLKGATDKALALYGDENAKEVVFKEPYEKQKKSFAEKIKALKEIAPNLEAIDALQSEEEKGEFVKRFRDVMRQKASLETFAEFSFDDLGLDEQEFYDYQSKYLDLYEERKRRESVEIESVLDQIDFEIELTLRDVINFDYIIQLLAGLKSVTSEKVRVKKTEEILKIFDQNITLRKKKELIKKFIEQELPKIPYERIEVFFEEFWQQERAKQVQSIAKKEGIGEDELNAMLGEYLYTQKLPQGEEIMETLPVRPKLREQQGVINRIKQALSDIVEIFEW